MADEAAGLRVGVGQQLLPKLRREGAARAAAVGTVASWGRSANARMFEDGKAVTDSRWQRFDSMSRFICHEVLQVAEKALRQLAYAVR